jgi:hypothetical protein
MLNTNAATVEKNYTIKISHGKDGEVIQDSNTHTGSEIIDRATEVAAKQMGQDLACFADLEVKLEREGDSDKTYYVDKSGKTVDFTEEMQFKAALAVLNSHDNYFEATPVR